MTGRRDVSCSRFRSGTLSRCDLPARPGPLADYTLTFCNEGASPPDRDGWDNALRPGSSSVEFRSGLEYDNLFRMEYRADRTFRRDNGYWTEARVTWGRSTCEKRRFSGFPASATQGVGAE